MTTIAGAVFRRALFGVSACVAGIAGAALHAGAQQTPAIEIGQAAQRAFNIPPQALESAVLLFGQQAGRQVIANASLLSGLSTQGVQGTMTVEEALRRLLSGTGLTYTGVGSGTISLHRAGQGADALPGAMQLDPVQVQGAFPVPPQAMIDNIPPPYAGGQVATGSQLGLLGNRPVMDTPFNQTSYTAKKAQDQQAKTVRDVLIDDPSVRFNRSDAGVGDNGFQIRGFNVENSDVSYGGLYGMLPTASIMAEVAERVEVLKGPSAMLFGMQPSGSVGGAINIVPKRAPDQPLTQLTANYISAAQFGGHVDVARRFGPDKELGGRFNGVYRSGQTDVQWNTDERALALVGLDFRGERFRLSSDLGYQYRSIGGAMPNLALANGVPLPWAPNVRNNPGSQPWNEVWYKDLFGVARAEFDITQRITAYAAFGAHDRRFSALLDPTITATNFNGTATTLGTMNNRTWNTYLTAEAGVRGFVDTGIIGHEFSVIGTTYYDDLGIGRVFGPPTTANFYYTTVTPRSNVPTPNATKTANTTLSSLALADTLSLVDKRIQLTLGARLQQVQSSNFNATTGALTTGYSESALSPSVSLAFKPWQNVSVYGNWIQGLSPGSIVPVNFANAGEVFPPFKSTQYEVGVKVDWDKFTTTASLFQISRPSILNNVAANTQYLGGEQVNQGLELNFFGEPTDGVRLLGGAMFLNPVLTRTQGGVTDGWIAPISPQLTLNLAGEWDLPFVQGLTLISRLIYTGSQYIDTTWPRRSLPEWTRFDLGARYAFENPGAKGTLLVARLNVENVLDTNYWAGGSSGALVLGLPRTIRLSLTAEF